MISFYTILRHSKYKNLETGKKIFLRCHALIFESENASLCDARPKNVIVLVHLSAFF